MKIPFNPHDMIPILSLSLVLSLVAIPGQAATDVTEFSLDQLMSMEITSVTKKAQPLSEAAAAIHVITQEDIRRSGMTSIPELLRLVPGLQVAQIDASKWAITSRGFNDLRSNKLLVLMDGRTLYSPLFSGVFWDVQDTALADIERIEIIRGPGGSIWGANAVNGVINIITRHSRDTDGGLVQLVSGNQERMATVRYGGKLAQNGWFRAFAKVTDRDSFSGIAPYTGHDEWDNQRAGFRADWETAGQNAITVHANIYNGKSDSTISVINSPFDLPKRRQGTTDVSGANLLLLWQRQQDQHTGWELQAYFDRASRDDLILDQRIDTIDLNFEHHFQLSTSQSLNWGVGYRRIDDDNDGSFTVKLMPADRKVDLYSLFIQDEIDLGDDFYLTLGTKFEYNDFTQFEYQPSVRLRWQLAPEHTLWAAISRAISTPSRSANDIRINVSAFSSPFVDPDGPGPLANGDPTLISIFGDTAIEAEELLAFEFGYRGQPISQLSLELSAFFNQYDNLITQENRFGLEGSPVPTHVLLSSTFDNQMEANSYGVELTAKWQISQDWQLTGAYTWLDIDPKMNSSSNDTISARDEKEGTPSQQFQIHSSWNINNQIAWNMSLYYVGDIEGDDNQFTHVSSYNRFDTHLRWSFSNGATMKLGSQNLLDNKHLEYSSGQVHSNQVPRSLYIQLQVPF